MAEKHEKIEKREKNSHCSYCGQAFSRNASWPRQCVNCGNISYINPIPVSVVLLPVDDGLLLIRRSIPPREGSLALPGGFINQGEAWQQAGAREVREETGISIDPEELSLFDVHSAPDGTVLIFSLAKQRRQQDLPDFSTNTEVSEMVVVPASRGTSDTFDFAFPLHKRVADRYWKEHENA